MRKFGFLMALLAVIFGIGGALLRAQELETVFDPVSGLAAQGAPISFALIGISVLTVGTLFALSFGVQRMRVGSFADAFGRSTAARVLLVLAGLTATGFSALEILSPTEMGALETVRVLVAMVSGVIGLVLMAALGTKGNRAAIAAVVPVFWLCLWLVSAHVGDQAANPVLLSYVYQLFALAALLLSFYYIAGYAFLQERPGRLMFSSSTAVYFTLVTLPDNWSTPQRAVLLALAITVLVYQLALCNRPAQTSTAPSTHVESWANTSDAEAEAYRDEGLWHPDQGRLDA